LRLRGKRSGYRYYRGNRYSYAALLQEGSTAASHRTTRYEELAYQEISIRQLAQGNADRFLCQAGGDGNVSHGLPNSTES